MSSNPLIYFKEPDPTIKRYAIFELLNYIQKPENCPGCGRLERVMVTTKQDEFTGQYAAYIECRKCGWAIPSHGWFDTKEEAVYDAFTAWNTRNDNSCVMLCTYEKIKPVENTRRCINCKTSGIPTLYYDSFGGTTSLKFCPCCGARVKGVE